MGIGCMLGCMNGLVGDRLMVGITVGFGVPGDNYERRGD